MWGAGENGELGTGNPVNEQEPKLVQELEGERLVSVSLGGFHTAAVTEKGDVLTVSRRHTSIDAICSELYTVLRLQCVGQGPTLWRTHFAHSFSVSAVGTRFYRTAWAPKQPEAAFAKTCLGDPPGSASCMWRRPYSCRNQVGRVVGVGNKWRWTAWGSLHGQSHTRHGRVACSQARPLRRSRRAKDCRYRTSLKFLSKLEPIEFESEPDLWNCLHRWCRMQQGSRRGRQLDSQRSIVPHVFMQIQGLASPRCMNSPIRDN